VPFAPDLSGSALDNRYELHAVIGEGAFGRVYAGRDRRLARSVAVKVIKPWWTEDPDWVATFEREAQLMARVSDPGIVQIYDVGHAPEGLYYVAELVDGENLAHRLRRGLIPAWEACGIATQLCRALAHAHARRIVHRDVKPANILLSRQGLVKVGDFGVARLAEGSTDGHGPQAPTIVGTPRYMAPEQGRGLPTSPATDVYSVGVVLYEMLAGKPPFSGVSVVELALSHLQEQPPPLSVRLPSSLVQITGRALAKDPAKRYADGAEMADALLDAHRRSATAGRGRLAVARTRAPGHAPHKALAGAGVGGGAGGRGPTLPGAGSRGPTSPGAGGRGPTLPEAGGRGPTSPRAGGRGPMLPGADSAPPFRPREPFASDSAAVTPRRRPVAAPPPPWRPDATEVAPELSPRRNVNPAARRRAVAALALVLALLAAMAMAAVALKPPARTRVPAFAHLRHGAALAAARRAHVTVRFDHRYDAAAVGMVIGQQPRAGARVAKGSAVHVTVSRGPAPVPVPGVAHESLSDAERSLHSLRLRVAIQYVPAPATRPGTVVGQRPAAEHSAAVGSTVHLSVAETPQWRPVTAFTGAGSGTFRIIGEHWRLAYSMSFQGTCTWIFWCSGPTARVIDAATGQTVTGFGLIDGSGQVRTFASGPGTYEIQVTPGADDARWSAQVQDDY
jgi:eukaryotic-like serine/threonine-protein kinase